MLEPRLADWLREMGGRIFFAEEFSLISGVLGLFAQFFSISRQSRSSDCCHILRHRALSMGSWSPLCFKARTQPPGPRKSFMSTTVSLAAMGEAVFQMYRT
jgi:hypothetical protein